MELAKVFEEPISSFAYLERFVNDGSPSGFSSVHGVSDRYRPRGGEGFYRLPVYSVEKHAVTSSGRLHRVTWAHDIVSSGHVAVPIHPDIVPEVRQHTLFRREPDVMLEVVPTASERTVLTDWRRDDSPMFIKLHYPKVVGRFVRTMPLFKWVASMEAGHFMRSYIENNCGRIRMFDEFSGVYVAGSENYAGFGTIFRCFPPEFLTGQLALIPAFALFSKDILRRADQTLIAQLIQKHGMSVSEFVERFIVPLITNYVHLASTAGLMPECHAQNIVYGIDENGGVARIFVRDMEDVWKDLTRREMLGLDSVCVGYHTIEKTNDRDYFQRRSFMYDFKLSQYIVAPLASAAAPALGMVEDELFGLIREVGKMAWKLEPDYFEPRDGWFCYSRTASVSRESYEKRSNPPFR